MKLHGEKKTRKSPEELLKMMAQYQCQLDRLRKEAPAAVRRLLARQVRRLEAIAKEREAV